MTTGVKTYMHTQSSASATWVVTHNLGLKPVCDVMVNFNGTVSKILPVKIIHDSDNQVTILFSTSHTGVVRLIGF